MSTATGSVRTSDGSAPPASAEPGAPVGTTRGAPAKTAPGTPARIAPGAPAGTAPGAPARTAPSEPQRAAAGSPEFRRIVGVLALGGLGNFALTYFVQPLLPRLADAFAIAPGDAGLALSSTTLAMIVGLFVAAPLSDRFGRGSTMAASLVVAGLAALACAAMPTWGLFLATRALAGLALAVLPAVALAYLRDRVDPRAHLLANSLYIAGTALGGAAGRLAPLPLAQLGGWQLASIVLGAFSILVGILVAVLLPRDDAPHVSLRIGDLLGGTLSAFRDRVVLAVCAIGLLNMVVFVSLYNAISFRLDAPPFSLGSAEALVYLSYLGGIVAPGAFRVVAARFGRGVAATIGAALLLVAVAVLALTSVVAVFVGLAVLTVAFLGTHSILTGWVVDHAARVGRSTARASSAYLLAFYLGSSIAGTASTQLWALTGWTGIIVVCAVVAVLSGALSLAMSRRRVA